MPVPATVILTKAKTNNSNYFSIKPTTQNSSVLEQTLLKNNVIPLRDM